MSRFAKVVKVLPERLAAVGTRVVVLRPKQPVGPGQITDVRTATHLKTYVVACDDGTVVYASAHDLALEADVGQTPLAPTPEY